MTARARDPVRTSAVRNEALQCMPRHGIAQRVRGVVETTDGNVRPCATWGHGDVRIEYGEAGGFSTAVSTIPFEDGAWIT